MSDEELEEMRDVFEEGLGAGEKSGLCEATTQDAHHCVRAAHWIMPSGEAVCTQHSYYSADRRPWNHGVVTEAPAVQVEMNHFDWTREHAEKVARWVLNNSMYIDDAYTPEEAESIGRGLMAPDYLRRVRTIDHRLPPGDATWC